MNHAKIAAALFASVLVVSACSKDKAADTTAAAAETTVAAAADTSAAAAADTTAAAAADTTAAAAADTTAAAATDTAAAVDTSKVDCKAADSLCVGLVTDLGKVDDKSFNQSAWEGAKQGAAAIGMKSEYIESNAQTDYAANIKQLIDNGNKVIITVGFALGDDTIKAAKANPTLKFIGVDQFQGAAVDNLTGLVFNEDKAGFMAGALAGLLTKTNTVGAVVGTDTVPPVVAFTKGWENGAKYTNPKVKAISVYHPAGDNAFNDPDWGATNAKQILDQGADIIFGAGGNTGNGALAEIAKKSGAFCVGVDSDQWETVPAAHPCLVTSAMKLITPGVVDLVKAAKDGSIKGGNFFGATGIAPFHDFDATISQEVKDKMAKIVADVQSGTLATGYTPS